MVLINIIYHDFGGSHTSILAANIHTDKISEDLAPLPDEMMSLPYFDKTTPDDFGKIHYIGKDDADNQVYTLGTSSSPFGYVLKGLTELMGIEDNFLFVDTMPQVNFILRIGGWLSRSLSLPDLGRPLIFKGIQDAHPDLVEQVKRAKIEVL